MREIKQAICLHGAEEPAGPPEHRAEWRGWRMTTQCRACGRLSIRALADARVRTPAPRDVRTGSAPPAAVAWDECEIRLRCGDRGTRTYPLCRYEAIALGPAGRYVAAQSAEFDNGIERAERDLILEALGGALARDRWEALAPDADRALRFRRPPAGAPLPATAV